MTIALLLLAGGVALQAVKPASAIVANRREALDTLKARAAAALDRRS